MSKELSLCVIAMLSCLFFSCNDRLLYEKTDILPQETWDMDSVLQYEVHITDSMQFYDIYIHVRNTTDFETQNFYVFLTTEYPNGFTGKDTLGCILCDARGQWTGKGSGRVKENRFVYKRNVRFPLTGIYKFTAVQGMRDKQVKGIADFGMSLYKIKKNK